MAIEELRPTCCASAAAEARRKNCQNSHDLARRRRSAASAGWAARIVLDAVPHASGHGAIRLMRGGHARRRFAHEQGMAR